MQSKFKQLQRLNQTKCCNETHGKCVLNPPQSGGKICYYSRDIDFFLRIVFIGAARTSIDDVIKTVNSHKINRSMLHERLGISYTVYFMQLNNRPMNVCSMQVCFSITECFDRVYRHPRRDISVGSKDSVAGRVRKTLI